MPEGSKNDSIGLVWGVLPFREHFAAKSGLSGTILGLFRHKFGPTIRHLGAKKVPKLVPNGAQMVNKWSGKVQDDFEKNVFSTIFDVILGCFVVILGQVQS